MGLCTCWFCYLLKASTCSLIPALFFLVNIERCESYLLHKTSMGVLKQRLAPPILFDYVTYKIRMFDILIPGDNKGSALQSLRGKRDCRSGRPIALPVNFQPVPCLKIGTFPICRRRPLDLIKLRSALTPVLTFRDDTIEVHDSLGVHDFLRDLHLHDLLYWCVRLFVKAYTTKLESLKSTGGR